MNVVWLMSTLETPAASVMAMLAQPDALIFRASLSPWNSNGSVAASPTTSPAFSGTNPSSLCF
ncbi:MAG: hypothetical protein ACYS83_00760 [Planctomycetota bacterium]